MGVTHNQTVEPASSGLLPTEIELSRRLDWLIALRWVAVLGALATIFIVPLFFKIYFPIKPLLLITGIIAVYNSVFFICQKIIYRRSEEITSRLAACIACLQIDTDLFVLMAMVHFSGGVENPFIFYFIFHVIIASILLSRRRAMDVALFAIFLFCSMVYLEYRHILPHYPLQGLGNEGLFEDEYYLLGTTFVFTTTVLISVFMASHITSRLRLRDKQIIQATASLKEKSQQLHEAYLKLKELDEEKSKFMMVTAHELRSPLSTIQTNLKVVLEGYTSSVDPRQKDMLTRAERRVMNLIEVVSDLLNLSQVESLRPDLVVEDIDIGQLLNGVIEQAQTQAQVKNINLSVKGPDGPLTIYSNKDYMEQLFGNLISNAVKYTRAGGRVEVKVWPEGENVCGQVTDTGIGIQSSGLDKIFDEFYRTEEAKKYSAQGTGLGLAIVQRIIQTHGGRISVESSPGKGTKFLFTLPRKSDKINNV